ncbi:SAM-dependent methyltransferase [Candidatus Eisenbacteria bacterium]|uniref:SAM-dependent methyltransferase n=1 Tax=Eiseniibacteriota bacterium TaxID=2212470 RepID=A0ABV6YJQ3_UNCEI
MNFFDLVDISERFMETINPSTPEKMLTVGRYLRLEQGNSVIDFGCGYAEALVQWAEHFGISGVGIDIRRKACERARTKVADRGLQDRIEIVCGKGAEYDLKGKAYDAAVCIGASFVWRGFRPTLQAMAKTVGPNARIAVGEPYWLSTNVPTEYAKKLHEFHSEARLLEIIREEGFDLEYLVRANHDDWDRYEAGNWYGLVRWLEENPDHPERADVLTHFRQQQDEYLRFGREFLGWAIYILTPAFTV